MTKRKVSKKNRKKAGEVVGWLPAGSAGGGYAARCAKTHPPLELGGRVIFGGSCYDPVVEADVYVALAEMEPTARSWPWTPGCEVSYRIKNFDVPKDPASFEALIGWIIDQLDEDRRVHVGCMGGHGRTGMVLAAVVARLGLDDDAIGYVRKNYCKKAVETESQVAFLVKHYGCLPAKPRDYGSSWGTKKATKLSGRGTFFDGVKATEDPFTDPINDFEDDREPHPLSGGSTTTNRSTSFGGGTYDDWLDSYRRRNKWP